MDNKDDGRYVAILEAIESHLENYADPRWPKRLREWIDEFHALPAASPERTKHYERTRRALGGMGSIADIVIAPEAGYRIRDDAREIREANRRLLDLVRSLDVEIDHILSKR